MRGIFILASLVLPLVSSLYIQKPVQRKATRPASPLRWTSSSKKSEMDGIVTTTLMLDATGNPDAALVIRCGGGKATVYVYLGDYVQPGAEWPSVRTKFDAGEPKSDTWGNSTNMQGLFSPTPSSLLRSLQNSKKFLFEFTPYEKRPKILTFDVIGFERVLNPIAKSCGEIPDYVADDH